MITRSIEHAEQEAKTAIEAGETIAALADARERVRRIPGLDVLDERGDRV